MSDSLRADLQAPSGDALAEFLKPLASEEILYVSNPGNGGDALIACATYQRFENLGIRYQCMDLDCPPERTRGRILVYGGGGNLVHFYGEARGFILRHHQGARRFILLPHTVRGHGDLLPGLGPNVDIICRDRDSYAYLRGLDMKAEVRLMDDVAFGLDVPAFMAAARARYWPLVSTRTLAWRNAKRLIRRSLHRLRNPFRLRALNAFRTDGERAGRPLPFANLDVSQVFAADNMTRECADEASYRILGFLDGFDVIHTDRLHVCIGALLLGKTVHFHDNSYGKNRAVYEYSMRGRFAKVVWHG
ncbi:MAG: Polysaccharide pyruvyl transferase [Rhodocyclaceae bacterium]|nr:Polysaccharide pyruvyl transferase [Rhodocyclaceae bacterium]